MRRLVQFGRYIIYFFRFSPLLALGLLYDELKGEFKYQVRTAGFERLDSNKIKGPAIYDAYSYMPSNYILLERVFDELNRFEHNQTLLDIGCGKGRVMLVAARHGFKDIRGVEMVKEYCIEALQNIKNSRVGYPAVSFEIICTDAGHYLIPDNMQVLFLYNPFKETLMDMVIGNILKSFHHSPRPLFVVYLNPLYKQNFINSGFREIYTTSRFRYLKACILSI